MVSVTTCPASVGVVEAGQVLTVPSVVPLAGSDPGVSTSVSVTTRPPAVQWTASASVGRASQATGNVSLRLETTSSCSQNNFERFLFELEIFQD